jgi:DNA-binding CsgD family transcriptional regulator
VVGQFGVWEWRPQDSQLLWSDNLYRIYGYEPGGVMPSPEVVYAMLHPDDCHKVTQHVADIARSARPDRLEYRIIVPGGGIRHLRSTLAIAERRMGRPSRLIGCVFDLTDQRSAEREAVFSAAISRALAEWRSPDRSVPPLLGALANALDVEIGIMWLPTDDVLVARAVWASRMVSADDPVAMYRPPVRPGAGPPGRAWREGDAVAGETGDAHVDAAGCGASIAVPVLHGDEVLAVLEFRSRAALHPSRALLDALTRSALVIGRFFARRRSPLQSSHLTPRELEVLRLGAQGLSAKEIASQLVVSPSTVRTHFEHIYGKLGTRDRASAVAHALRGGLIE